MMLRYRNQMLESFMVLALLVFSGSIAKAGDKIFSDFKNEDETWKIWCEAQINKKHGPVTFHRHNPEKADKSDRFIAITAIEESLGGNRYNGKNCREIIKMTSTEKLIKSQDVELEKQDDLGPPVFELSPEAEILRQKTLTDDQVDQKKFCPGTVWDPHSPSSKPYCTREKIKFAKSRLSDGGEEMNPDNLVCMQRQEVRFHPQNIASRHYYNQTRSYRIRFRLPKDEEICDRHHGLRWVNVQWKLKPLVGGSRSPFLAQRFDNGNLFVTVQAKSCRCIVAAAETLKPKLSMVEGQPLLCQWTGPKPKDPLCTPEHVNLRVNYGSKKWLENTLGSWSEITYSVKPHLKSGRIEIRQDGDLISTVTGMIGYKPKNKKTRVKFKFGQYRDYQPREHVIEFDEIELGPVE